MELILFFFGALLAIGGGVFLITFTQVRQMAWSLAVSFVILALLFYLLDASLIVILLYLILIGGLLSGVMFVALQRMGQMDEEEKWRGSRAYRVTSFLGVGAFFCLLLAVIYLSPASGEEEAFRSLSWNQFLYELANTSNLLPFELLMLLWGTVFLGSMLLIKKKEGD